MRPERHSTICKERELNYALRASSREEFVRLLTAELPDRPGYFAQDAEINRTGAIPLDFLLPMEAFTPDQVFERQRAGDIVLDTRPAMEFGAGHVPGSVNIPLAGQFAGSAGALLGLEHDLIIVAEDQAAVEESRTRLARVGFERVAGYLDGGMTRWAGDLKPTAQIMQISAEELRRELSGEPESIQIVDVRRKPEWDQGHIPGALHKPLDHVTEMLGDLDREKPIVVHCKGGYRSAIACSLLQRAGFENVTNLIGGFDAWQTTGVAVSV
jgi:hydroxyacylglutathione hydrolase